jgi:hypothetical protein
MEGYKPSDAVLVIIILCIDKKKQDSLLKTLYSLGLTEPTTHYKGI